MAIHQFIPYLHGPGDASADLAYAFRNTFRDRGYKSEIYALQVDAAADGLLLDQHQPAEDDLVLYHYVGGSDMTDVFKQHPGPGVVYYHNVTPPELIHPFHAFMADALAVGRKQIRELTAYPALVPSEYSRQELLSYGFTQVRKVPILVDFERLFASAESDEGQRISAQYTGDTCYWLAMGRIAPNKRCEDIIKAFAYYHRWINRDSRLIFVGGDKHFLGYAFNLNYLAEKFEVADTVEWHGWVDYGAGFGAYYKIASMFVLMSEHEGFGVPLLEAMAFNVPVLAYKAAAVPHTLGESGVLVCDKHFESIAEMAHILHTNSEIRAQVIQTQEIHLRNFSRQFILEQLMGAISSFLPSAF